MIGPSRTPTSTHGASSHGPARAGGEGPPRDRAGAAPGRARADRQGALRRVRALANLLDQRFRLPGTPVRFGYDSIVGLLPVVGDSATALIGLYIVVEAVRLGTRKRVVARMLLNIVVDWLLGLVPLLDIVLDVAFKANLRNARLLERELRRGGVHER